MKANAPEKLYVDINDNFNDSILYGFTEKNADEDIEYVRVDIFIERAVEFLHNYNHEQLIKYGQIVFDCGQYNINVNKFIKYMKG